jgi:hypothetical protein
MTDESGVWRTIGGRRVFIKDGQSLTDAMRESGKFGDLKKKSTAASKKQTVDTGASAEYGVEHRVWGKATGTSYEALKDDQYKLTGEKTGETLQIPKMKVENLKCTKRLKYLDF